MCDAMRKSLEIKTKVFRAENSPNPNPNPGPNHNWTKVFGAENSEVLDQARRICGAYNCMAMEYLEDHNNIRDQP